MYTFLLLQLSFNILILIGLIVLAAGRRRQRKPAASGAPARVASFKGTAGEAASPVPAGTKRPTPTAKESGVTNAGGLDDLIEHAEREEMVAESALRQRLQRLRAQAAG